eukprot:TRINITY_DN1545_c0_g1_i3.p1 TRINITY_DN1545_c0_g1~~TRINITY_DN1545_c0_g1_i3.p1  ORF type:complete len:311 (-),score=98.80 TRINITY_DN1545_c0_g1_i3:108-1040(-)
MESPPDEPPPLIDITEELENESDYLILTEEERMRNRYHSEMDFNLADLGRKMTNLSHESWTDTSSSLSFDKGFYSSISLPTSPFSSPLAITSSSSSSNLTPFSDFSSHFQFKSDALDLDDGVSDNALVRSCETTPLYSISRFLLRPSGPLNRRPPSRFIFKQFQHYKPHQETENVHNNNHSLVLHQSNRTVSFKRGGKKKRMDDIARCLSRLCITAGSREKENSGGRNNINQQNNVHRRTSLDEMESFKKGLKLLSQGYRFHDDMDAITLKYNGTKLANNNNNNNAEYHIHEISSATFPNPSSPLSAMEK